MVNYFHLLETATTTNKANSISTFLLFGVMVLVMYLFMIRPQKKRQKEEQLMRDNLQVGDEIITIGGIIGKVVTVKEDSIVIESGADRVKTKITRWAIQTNSTALEKANAEIEASKKARVEAEKERRKEKESNKEKK